MISSADLCPETLERVRDRRYDYIGEKHEGPFDWSWQVKSGDLEFLDLAGYPVLLPIGREQHPNITLLRCIPSADGESQTLFLKDTTYSPEPEMEMFFTGRLAVCDRMPGESFYIAIAYHEWFIVEN
jgi:hypothetical protein